MKIKYRHSVYDTIQSEGITKAEVAEAIRIIEDAAAGKPKPLHLNLNIEAIRDTNLTWYRLKPKGATYRIAFSVDRNADTLIVEGIFRRDAHTYDRIKRLFNEVHKGDKADQ